MPNSSAIVVACFLAFMHSLVSSGTTLQPATEDEATQSADAAGLSEQDAEALVDQMWADLANEIERALPDDAHGAVEFGLYRMRLLERVFGDPDAPQPKPLWISLHGGGNAPANVNDQQWHNQMRMYEPEDGVYIAPRAPTNEWNLWHQPHVDALLGLLIARMVATRNVDPERVYLLGYSAGGDGVYQLAPRMADRFAAASMMAGHPNDARPESLRNLPFAIYMGGEDSAYNRNDAAAQWRDELAQLAKKDPGAYEHRVRIYPELGHWMAGKDREAIAWMAGKTRETWPQRVVWRQDDVSHTRFYWLQINAEDAKPGRIITASVKGQTIEVECRDPVPITLLLRDALIDLDRDIQVVFNGHVVFNGFVPRTQDAINRTLADRPDPPASATATLSVAPPVNSKQATPSVHE